MNQPHTHSEDIVVALDGSPSGQAALAWAADYARTTNARLQALHIISYAAGSPTVWAPGVGSMAYVVSAQSVEDAQSEVQDVFDAIHPEPGWKLHFIEGPIGHELVRQSAGARMLVVGTQEHTGLGRMLLGSVSHFCLSRAECPVVAVPAPVPPREHTAPLTIVKPRVAVVGAAANGAASTP